MIDRVVGRLSAWKAKLLSIAGRATLIQAVTSAIPNHVMQTNWLPSSTCNQLDKLNRNFLWSSDISQRKLHLVGWHKVTRPKNEGGLGIRQARKANIALLAKVGWRTLNGENRLWGDTFRSKYLKNEDILAYKIKGGDSFTWKGVVRSLKEVERCIRWRIGDGSTISVWRDLWVGKEPLAKALEGEIHEEDLNLNVAQIINEHGLWDRRNLRTVVPDSTWDMIRDMPLPLELNRVDKRIWSGTSNGGFSCKSAYGCLNRTETNSMESWDWLWRIKCPERIRFFLWICLHNSLATNKLRYERKIADSNTCSRCNHDAESVIHALQDCVFAKGIWEFVIAPTQFLEFCQDKDGDIVHDDVESLRVKPHSGSQSNLVALGSRSGDRSKWKLKSVVTLALTILTSSQSILIFWSKRAGNYEYSVTTANFLVEALKCALSLAALARIWRNEGVTDDNRLSTTLDEVSVYPIPAALYLFKNLLQYYIFAYVDAPGYQILKNLNIISTGILYRIILKKKLSEIQWAAFVLLCAGCTTAQLKSNSDNQVLQTPFQGWLMAIIMALLSGFAGVYTEAIIKKRPSRNINVQNFWLYIFGMAFNAIAILVQDFDAVMNKGFFHGYSLITVLMILNHALSGIAVSMVMKYADNIVKVYSTSVAMLLTAFVSVFLFRFHLSLAFFLGST
ncbi:hypothetical protein RD792_016497 [Penstemon davidsonii]|uniref:Reverse transcriptase zinc-binding domain-containing protein n=1 Tax=Penstemon davidsonii TaxID=160366 RepID=A0ABR0CL84_9LAMI|nr:hypothetical protein RD792_016497 [Penstemon davidsonii]